MTTTRHRPHRLLCLLLVGAMALAGCGDADIDEGDLGSAPGAGGDAAGDAGTADDAAEEADPAGEAAGGTGGQLFLANWTDYTPPELIDKFEEETGIAVTLDVYDSNETLLSKMQAGGAGYDLVVPSDYMVQIMIELDLLQPVDAMDLPNAGNLAEDFVDVYFDPGRRYSIPYLYGTTGYTYDTAVIDEELDSWAEFFDPPEAARGRMGILNDQFDVINAALRATGNEPCSADPEALAEAEQLLLDFKPHVEVINSDGVIERMASGEQVLHMQWNGAAQRSIDERDTLRYVYPAEGLTLWQDNFVVPADARNVENARTFMDFMLEPENAAIATNFAVYSNAVEGSEAFVDEALADSPSLVVPDEFADRPAPVPPCSEEAITLFDRVWTTFLR
jgi:spermidine/putrescine transport system substrate-binding protein